MTDERDRIDPALDAAWRAHARDEPPRALDDAILAAAHRAVASGPRAQRTRRRWSTWAPLAVAATLGAIAFGVVQLAPHEEDATRSVVGDTPAASPRAPAASSRVPVAEPSGAPASPASSKSEQRPGTRPSAGEPKPATASARKAAPAPSRDAVTAASAPQAPAPAPSQATKPPAPRPYASAPTPPPASEDMRQRADAAQNFAAAPAPAEAPQDRLAKRQVESEARLERQAASPSAKPDPFPAPARDTAGAAAPAAAPASPPAAAGTVGGVRPGVTDAKDADATSMRESAGASTPPRAKVATARTADDFVRDIRRLRAEGRDADAALALAAFRAAYADADERLPADLRAWARTIARP
jgi:hypothetical protein